MKKLILKEFRCVNDTDEWGGSDSPYFITFVGDITRPAADNSRIQVTARGEWHDEVEEGELFVVDEVIDTGSFSLNPAQTVVLVALIEENEGFDITRLDGAKLKKIQGPLSNKLFALKKNGANKIDGGAYGNFIDLRDMFEKNLKNVLAESSRGDEDDLLGIRPTVFQPNLSIHPWLTGQTGNQPLMYFLGDGGNYKVRYIVE
jgi:hypothetical protein